MGDSSVIELVVQGMTCGHCVMAVKKSLAVLPGVSEVEVTLEPPRARVTIDPDAVSPEALAVATGREGYPSSVASG